MGKARVRLLVGTRKGAFILTSDESRKNWDIDQQTYKCRNQKAKKKLQWEKVPKMNKEEQKDFIAEMFEVLEAGKMPPKKALERRPQMKLNLDAVI